MYTRLDETGFINPHKELLLTSLQPEHKIRQIDKTLIPRLMPPCVIAVGAFLF